MRDFNVFRLLSALLAVGLAVTAHADDPREGETGAPPAQRGVALGLYYKDFNASYLGFLQEIKALGASHVSIVHPWYMKTARDVEIFQHPVETVPMQGLVQAIDDAQAIGLQVFLFPILRVEDKSEGWRGTLNPRDVGKFFDNYKAFILRFAKIAEEKGIPLLSVGSELATMESHKERWLDIIHAVRQVYGGKLVYSSNWDNYQNTPFVDALDYIGVTGYFELAEEKTTPNVEDLIHAWRYIYYDLIRLSEAVNKPLIITEVGYLSQKEAAAWPWKEGADEPVDYEIQRKCYEAFRRIWDGEPRLAGSYFWQWFGDGNRVPYEYTPRGKPAAGEIAKWYAQETPAASQTKKPEK